MRVPVPLVQLLLDVLPPGRALVAVQRRHRRLRMRAAHLVRLVVAAARRGRRGRRRPAAHRDANVRRLLVIGRWTCECGQK